MADSVKQITLTGGAAEDFQNGGTRRKRRQRKGDIGATGTPTPTSITYMPSPQKKMLVQGGNPLASRNNIPPEPPAQPAQQVQQTQPAPINQLSQQPQQPQQQPLQQQQQGGEITKLVLKPPKRRETRLLMKAPKGHLKQQTPTTTQTRKNVKKLTLGLRNLTVKIQRATKLHKKVGTMKKEDVKKLLVEKGIIKPGRKDPPEALMRQMYSDYLILTSKGL